MTVRTTTFCECTSTTDRTLPQGTLLRRTLHLASSWRQWQQLHPTDPHAGFQRFPAVTAVHAKALSVNAMSTAAAPSVPKNQPKKAREKTKDDSMCFTSPVQALKPVAHRCVHHIPAELVQVPIRTQSTSHRPASTCEPTPYSGSLSCRSSGKTTKCMKAACKMRPR